MAALSTDTFGKGEVKFAFPHSGIFAGVFQFTRMMNGQTESQFVTVFDAPSVASNAIQSGEEGGGEKNFEVNLQPASMIAGGLGPCFGANGTDPIDGRAHGDR